MLLSLFISFPLSAATRRAGMQQRVFSSVGPNYQNTRELALFPSRTDRMSHLKQTHDSSFELTHDDAAEALCAAGQFFHFFFYTGHLRKLGKRRLRACA
jgi:hypothetical protein